MQSIVGPSLRMFYCVAELANEYNYATKMQKKGNRLSAPKHTCTCIYVVTKEKKR